MKILTIANQKGGVGKSTTALALGEGLHARGYKVLYIDLDAQANLTYSLGIEGAKYGSLGVLERPETIKEEIIAGKYGDVIPATNELTRAEKKLDQVGKEYRLKEALELIKEKYDYIIIDTPPALNVLLVDALVASDGVIIPVDADAYAYLGILELQNTLEPIKKYCNDKLKILGLLVTRYNARATLSRDIIEKMEQLSQQLETRLYKAKIRQCIAIKEAEVRKISVYAYAPKSNASIDYNDFIEELLEQLEGE